MSDRPYTHSWDRRPGEDAHAHEALIKYLAQGPRRSLRYTARLLKVHQRTVEAWSVKYDWKERVKAFEDYRAQQRSKAMLAAIKNSAAREVQGLLDTIEVIVMNAQRMKADFRKDKTARLGARSHKDLLVTAYTLARLYRGEPGTIELTAAEPTHEDLVAQLKRALANVAKTPTVPERAAPAAALEAAEPVQH